MSAVAALWRISVLVSILQLLDVMYCKPRFAVIENLLHNVTIESGSDQFHKASLSKICIMVKLTKRYILSDMYHICIKL